VVRKLRTDHRSNSRGIQYGLSARAALVALEIVFLGFIPTGLQLSRRGQLSRGNAYLDLLSFGGPSLHVPPLPGKIDSPVAGGIATRDHFEGTEDTRFQLSVLSEDAAGYISMTRRDAAIGDNRN
jgi:hypothetical protein